jgi:probable HAF family extracellular repeat protein
MGISSTGLVTGQVTNGSGVNQPFSWSSSGGFTLIPVLTGFDWARGLGINAGNEVVGFAQSGGYSPTKAGFVWTPSGGVRSIANGAFIANAVNDSGTVAGNWRSSSSSYAVAATWTPAGGVRVIGTLPGGYTSDATAINSRGQVVGWSYTASGLSHAFLWSPSTGMRDLGTLPDDVQSYARAINSAGSVVGESADWSRTHAFIWTASAGVRQLPPLGLTAEDTHAYGIDAKGRATGFANSYGQTYGNIAIYWNPGATPLQLPVQTGTHAGTVTGMNDAGQVSGYRVASDWSTRAVLWTLP